MEQAVEEHLLRLAVISDVHLEFRGQPPLPVPEADVFIVAGDLHPDLRAREDFLCSLPGEVLFVPGNHDYYGHDFPAPEDGLFTREINGVRFAGATLWTGFPERWWPDFKHGMTDARVIRGISWERMQEVHAHHLAFLREAGADVVITHHAPSYACVPPRMDGSIYNPFYVSSILDREGHGFEDACLWIHGHVHACQKVRAGGVSVLCHARGYPMEQGLAEDFRLLDVVRDEDGALRVDDVPAPA